MASRIMYRNQAMEYCHTNGYKLFIDMLIKDKVVIFENLPKPILINIIDEAPVVIERNGKVVYTELPE